MKNRMNNKLTKKQIIYGIAFSIAIGIVSFIPILVQNNGQYMDYGDYYLQYIPFIKEMKRMFISGGGGAGILF